MPTITIYGLECSIPEQPPLNKIDGHKLPVKKQKFKRVDHQSVFKEISRDQDGKPIWTAEQNKFILEELDKCDYGYWFMNRGVPTYINGYNYYYLSYWVLENGVRPEYRESDRQFFLFFKEAYDDPQIIGITRLKKRREGATSMGTCTGTRLATFEPNFNYGNISNKDTNAKKMFQKMIRHGFYKLPEFLQPTVDTSSTNKEALNFVETPKKGKQKEVRTIGGLNSQIDYEATVIGSYDSTRLSFAVLDESGKWERLNVNEYLELTVIECVKEGARKVGFLYMPTTVNAPNKGGKNYKELWDASNQFTYGPHQTPSKLVRYFQPAYIGYNGFIDEYGQSVVNPPDSETLEYLVNVQKNFPPKERIPREELAKGAKKHLLDELAKLTNEERIDEFKRKFPFTEMDSFSFGSTVSPFNTTKIQYQLDSLIEHPEPLRRGNLFYDQVTKKVEFSDDRKGGWLIYKLPSAPNEFAVNENGSYKIAAPLNSHKYKGGVDTYRFDVTAELGSNGVICIGTTYDSTDEESGEINAMYVGRPKLTEQFWAECLKGACFYGAKLNFEKDATQEYKKYFNNTMPNFLDANCYGFLLRKPDAAIDTSRKVNRMMPNDFGVSSADKYIFAKEIELGQSYVERSCHKIPFPELLQELLEFDVDNRTKYDRTIAFMVWLLGITGETKARKAQARKEPLIQVYQY